MRPTVGSALAKACSVYADKIAIWADGQAFSYAELGRWSDAVARQLMDLGVAAGHVVAIYTRNCVEFVVVDIAIAKLGAVKLPVNFMLPVETIRYELELAEAKVLVIDEAMAAANGTAVMSPPVGRLAVLQAARAGATLLPGARWLAALAPSDTAGQCGHEFVAADSLTAHAAAAIYFTGGTTGRPKGAVHSQASSIALHLAQLAEAEIAEDDVLLLATPLAHAAGLFAQSALIRGAQVRLSDGFEIDATLELFAAGAVTWCFLVPTMINRLLDAIAAGRGAPPVRLRTLVYGAAPIARTRLEQALDIFGPVFVQLYGQTECPNWGTRLAKSDHDLRRPQLLDSCGRASLLAEVKVVGDDGVEVDAGEIGEVCLRSPYLLDRYLDNPAATAEKFLGDWIKTGDVGFRDPAGYLYLKDRKADMIISGGMNVYCAEVEGVLSGHDSVAQIAVIGIPHDDWGEAVHAVVVPAHPDFSVELLRQWARELLPVYARPKSFEVVTQLPETPLGKIDKKALRAPFWSASTRGIS
jgi:fatty-acyl-CoA synthase